jgi:hypothetical protein
MMVLAVVTPTMTLLYVRHARRTVDAMVTRSLDDVTLTVNLQLSLLRQRGLEASYMLDESNEEWLREIDSLDPMFRTNLKKIVKRAEDFREHALLTDLGAAFSRYDARRDEVVSLLRAGDAAAAKKLHLGDLDALYRETAVLSGRVVDESLRDIETALRRRDREVTRLTTFIVVAVYLAGLFGAGLLWLTLASLFPSLHRLARESRSSPRRPGAR